MSVVIARDTELKTLFSLLKTAKAGSLQIAFITGEAGIGKTWLLSSFVREAQREVPDLVIAGYECSDVSHQQQEAYVPFVEMLRRLTAHKKNQGFGTSAFRIIRDVAPDWVGVVPGLGGLVAAIMRTAQSVWHEFDSDPDDIDSRGLMVQYSKALNKLAEKAPLLLWIDNLQMSDSGSLNLIKFLADQRSQARVMIIGAYRTTEIDNIAPEQSHSLKRLISELLYREQCSQIPLAPFEYEGVAKYCAATKHRFSHQFLEQLLRRSGGNPFFVSEYLKALGEQGVLLWTGSEFVLKEPSARIDVPRSIHRVVKLRLSLISSELEELLSVACIQGGHFYTSVLAHQLDSSESSVLAKLDVLHRKHLLVRELDQQPIVERLGVGYRFTHGLFQETLYRQLGEGQRTRLHALAADILEDIYGESIAQYASDLAIHYERAGNTAKAVEYYLQSARNAIAALSLDDAMATAKKVTSLSAKVEHNIRTVYSLEALLIIAEINKWRAKYETALKCCAEGYANATVEGLQLLAVKFLHLQSRILSTLGDKVAAVESIEDGMALLGDSPSDRALYAALCTRLASYYQIVGVERVQQALGTALAIADEENLPAIQARALMREGWFTANRLGEYEHALSLGERALAIAKQEEMIYEQITCHRLIAYAGRFSGQDEKALFHAQKAVEITDRFGLPRSLHAALQTQALCEKLINESWWRALRISRKAIDVADQFHFPPQLLAIANWMDLATGLGSWDEAEVVSAYFSRTIPDNHVHGWVWYYRKLGSLYFARAQFVRAQGALKRAIQLSKEHSVREPDLRRCQVDLAEIFIELDDIREAQQLIDDAQSFWTSRKSYFYFARSLCCMAQISLKEGEAARALTLLNEALDSVTGFSGGGPFPIWARVCIDLAATLLKLDRLDEAIEPATTGYEMLKKVDHVLLGEAAFVIGKILMTMGNTDAGLRYLNEARTDWQRHQLIHNLPLWSEFMNEHGAI